MCVSFRIHRGWSVKMDTAVVVVVVVVDVVVVVVVVVVVFNC